ncbi:hypothetical protein L7F22_044762 [Adiantum nelumboides]|nr:hypothetical protein [Adiantum nelumboides]
MDTVYISHGSPMLALDDCPARDFLRRWQEFMPEKPKAVLAISAHWTTMEPSVSTTPNNSTIHDFYGFPPDLYQLKYDAPGAPGLAKRVKHLLNGAGFHLVEEHSSRGLDHGAWVPLLLMYPEVDIPVCQLSVQPYQDALHHYELGRALAPLRNEGVLIMASGSATHNLRTLKLDSSLPPSWATSFDDWLNDCLVTGRFDDVIQYETKAPNARKAHPSPEHFLPLLVALGAAGDGAKARRIHTSWAVSTLSMASFTFTP